MNVRRERLLLLGVMLTLWACGSGGGDGGGPAQPANPIVTDISPAMI